MLAPFGSGALFASHADDPTPSAGNPEEEVSPQELQKFTAFWKFIQKRNAQKFAVTGANKVEEASYVKVGGIDQWITIRGNDRNKKSS